MPIQYKRNMSSMLDTINNIQKGLKSKEFNTVSHNGKKQMYAELFASRSAADAQRGKKSSLKVAVDTQMWEQRRNELIQSSSFQGFLEQQGHEKMKELLLEGHGGAAEDAFHDYVMTYATLPSDVPDRYMPTAKERITQQQKKLETLNPESNEALACYAEIFRTRRAVEAVRKKGATVEGKINGQKYAQAPDLLNNQVFRDFVMDNGQEFHKAVTSGNGGAGEEMFEKHLINLDHIPQNAPAAYMPTAYDHLESLKAKLKKDGSTKENAARLTEVMATRQAIRAVRKQEDSLKHQLSPAELHQAYEEWSNCATFQNYVRDHEAEAVSAGAEGHGGLLQDKFREHVMQLDHIPGDVPEGYMPTAYDHLEQLKKKLASESDYMKYSPERKLDLMAEIMASRQVVKAVRKDSDSLKKRLNPKQLDEAHKKWANCKAFKEYVQSTDPKIQMEIREAAHSGHGGALGDKFRDYVTNRGILDEDIPDEFMPSALTRTASLVKKIKEGPELSKEEKTALYTELMASRASVEAVRGKSKTLEKPIDGKKLKEAREALQNSSTFKNFINNEDLANEIREAAIEGHGGALEEKFQEHVLDMDHIPEDVPQRYMPTALKRVDKLSEKIKGINYPLEEQEIDLFAEMMGTRQAVGAEGTKEGPLKVDINPKKLQPAVKQWKDCKSFRDFVAENEDAKKAALEGHGGALAEKFKEHIKSMDRLPEDAPDAMIPTALERADALRANIQAARQLDDRDQEVAIYAQILAARRCVGAIHNKKDSLKKAIDPKLVNKTADELTNCKAFQNFFKSQKNLNVARESVSSGHGGTLEEGFKYYVSAMPQLGTDIPEAYLPTAEARIDGLKDQIQDQNFDAASLNGKITIYAELLAARRSVNAERKNVDSLKRTVDPKVVQEKASELSKCSAFREFVEKNPRLVKSAATSGHGGELEDKFKEYVLNLDKIPEDVPKEYMPTALKRTEALKKKIKSSEFRNYPNQKQNMFYKELAATRAAVNSIRGNEKSLDITVDAKRLNEIRQGLNTGDGPDKAFDNLGRRELYDAAISGHGGALEDLIKQDVIKQTAQSGKLPKQMPERYRPTIAETRLAIQKDLAAKNLGQVKRDPEQFKNQIATVMHLYRVEVQAKQKGQPVPTMKADYMETEPAKLKKSEAFQEMFKDDNAIRLTLQNAGKGSISKLYETHEENKAAIQNRQAQQQRELQNELPKRHADEPLRKNNNNNMQLDQEEQNQIRRRNSVVIRNNDPRQL